MFDSPATLLYRLQAVDQAIHKRRVRIKEINALIGQNEAVMQATRQVDAATAALKPWQARARDLDLEMKGVADKLKATESHLYSGRVTDPRAMQDIQNEIAALKRSQARLEDDALDAMMHGEDEQARLDGAQKALAEAQAKHADSQVDLRAEKERLEGEVRELDVQRKTGAAIIDAGLLATYDALRPKKNGSPVALIKDTSCTACQVEQTMSLVQKVQDDKTLVYCATCGRILAPRA